MSQVSAFFAYPSKSSEIAQTIKQAESDLARYHATASLKLWEQLDIPGRFIAETVLEGITKADVLVADITLANFNVVFEIGFAIGQGKRVVIVMYSPLEATDKDLREEVGIFDTLGFKKYQNSKDLAAILKALPEEKPRAMMHSANKLAPVYLTEDRWHTDGATRIISRVRKARLGFRSFDPNEQPRLSALDAMNQVSQSYGVLVHLISEARSDSKVANIRGAFIAGLAKGMQKELLLLQQGDDPIPLDYRDLVSSYSYPVQIDEYISDFAGRVWEAAQGIADTQVDFAQTSLSKLDLGASSAENETRELGDYYLPTESFRRAQRGEVRLVLGRKGSGKTAIFIQVRDRLRSKKNVVLDFKPDGYRLVKFRDQVLALLDRGTAEHTVTAFWEFLLCAEMAHKILEADKDAHRMDDKLSGPYKVLQLVYRSYDYEQKGDFAERMSRLLSSIEADFKISIGANASKSMSGPAVTELIHKKDVAELQRALIRYLLEKESLWILFDNIDKGWASHGIAKEDLVIVKGLIEATRKIERIFQQKDIEAHTLVFLRNDVYELLIDDLPDRGKEPKAVLDWTDAEMLRELIRRRAEHSGCETSKEFASLWSSVCISHIDGEESSQFLIDRCLMRPRFLIDLVHHCRGNALTLGHERIEVEDIRAGVALLSRDLVSELGHEIRDIHPAAEDVIYSFTGCARDMSQDDITYALMEAKVPDDNHERVLQLLLWYGFLGVLDDDNEPKFIYQVQYNVKLLETYRQRRTAQAKCFQVNPAFWPTLSVRLS